MVNFDGVKGENIKGIIGHKFPSINVIHTETNNSEIDNQRLCI